MWLFIPLLVSAAGLALAKRRSSLSFTATWGRANRRCLSCCCERWPWWRFKLSCCGVSSCKTYLQPAFCIVAKCNGNFCPVAHFIGRLESWGRPLFLGSFFGVSSWIYFLSTARWETFYSVFFSGNIFVFYIAKVVMILSTRTTCSQILDMRKKYLN